MEIKVINTFKDAEQIWLGLEKEGLRRKVFRAVDHAQLGAEQIVAGITIFEPGERCAAHSHPGSEEINFVVKGGGITTIWTIIRKPGSSSTITCGSRMESSTSITTIRKNLSGSCGLTLLRDSCP
ncbi:MAG: hypothetical protein RRA15_03070 [bacterium]|nr:hypothetical protein [bacterium]